MIVSLRVNRVLVTGGSSGIGFEIAKKLIEEGCRVCICSRNPEHLKTAMEQINSNDFFTVCYDVTKVNDFKRVLDECEAKMGGKLDGLVNSAGIGTMSIGRPGLMETENVWDMINDTDLKSVVFLTRQFAIYLKENGILGNILNISSAQGTAAKAVSAYQLAKGSVIRFTRGIAKDFAKYGIVINGIAPGATFSNMTPRPANHSNITNAHAMC